MAGHPTFAFGPLIKALCSLGVLDGIPLLHMGKNEEIILIDKVH